MVLAFGWWMVGTQGMLYAHKAGLDVTTWVPFKPFAVKNVSAKLRKDTPIHYLKSRYWVPHLLNFTYHVKINAIGKYTPVREESYVCQCRHLGVHMYDPSLQVANQFLYICKNQMSLDPEMVPWAFAAKVSIDFKVDGFPSGSRSSDLAEGAYDFWFFECIVLQISASNWWGCCRIKVLGALCYTHSKTWFCSRYLKSFWLTNCNKDFWWPTISFCG